jgi:hypothetical protein
MLKKLYLFSQGDQSKVDGDGTIALAFVIKKYVYHTLRVVMIDKAE